MMSCIQYLLHIYRVQIHVVHVNPSVHYLIYSVESVKIYNVMTVCVHYLLNHVISHVFLTF